jgi:hypothetical protein
MTPERMRQYGKGLGLWKDKRLATAEPISYLRPDHPIRVEPVARAKGFWVEYPDPANAGRNGSGHWHPVTVLGRLDWRAAEWSI